MLSRVRHAALACLTLSWLLLASFTACDYLAHAGQPEPSLPRHEVVVGELEQAHLTTRLASVEAEIKGVIGILDRMERWVLLFFGALGGKMLIERRAIARLQKQLEAVEGRTLQIEENQHRQRESLHRINGTLHKVLSCPETGCPLLVARIEDEPDGPHPPDGNIHGRA